MPASRSLALALAVLLAACTTPGETNTSETTPMTTGDASMSDATAPDETKQWEPKVYVPCDNRRPNSPVTSLVEGSLQDVAELLADALRLDNLTASEDGDAEWQVDEGRMSSFDDDFEDLTPSLAYDPVQHFFEVLFQGNDWPDNLSVLRPLAEAVEPDASWVFAPTGAGNEVRLVHEGLELVDPTMMHGGPQDEATGYGGVAYLEFRGIFSWDGDTPLPHDILNASTQEALKCWADAHDISVDAFEAPRLAYVQQIVIDGNAVWRTVFDHPPGQADSRDCGTEVTTYVDPVNGSWTAGHAYNTC